LGVVGVLAVAWAAVGRALSYDVSQAELQTRVERLYPYENCKLLLACVTLAEPRVELIKGVERIGVASQLAIKGLGREARGRIRVSGRLRYEADKGSLFLADFDIDSLEVDGLSTRWAQTLRSNLPSVLRVAFERVPVWTLDDRAFASRVARLALRDVRVEDGRVRIRFRAP
jgi:hypothetical protein